MPERDALLIIVDDNDKPIGTATKPDIVKRKYNYRCTHIYLFNSKDEILISKRPHFKRRYPDKWTASAGGKVDAGESYDECAHRELKEELGVETDLVSFGKISLASENGYTVFHTLYMGDHEGPFEPDPKEIEEVEWVSLEWLEQDIEKNPGKYAAHFQETFKLFHDNQQL